MQYLDIKLNFIFYQIYFIVRVDWNIVFTPHCPSVQLQNPVISSKVISKEPSHYHINFALTEKHKIINRTLFAFLEISSDGLESEAALSSSLL